MRPSLLLGPEASLLCPEEISIPSGPCGTRRVASFSVIVRILVTANPSNEPVYILSCTM